jgi:chitinase
MKRLFMKEKVLLFVLTFAMIITNLISFTTSAAKPDRSSPTVATNLRTVTTTENSVALAWNSSTDNVGVVGYNIYRDSVYIGKATTTAFTSSGLTPTKTYKFFVRAKDAAGNLSNTSNVLTVTTSTPPTPTPVIKTSKMVGYYAAWAAYSGYTPDKLDASKLTHINYAFANIGSDLKIALGYADVDPSNISKLNALKQTYPNLKTLISVGGWSWSDKFSDVALTET